MTIGETAKAAGISVRTLHYYDSIGLLRPRVNNSGYRLYSEGDLEKLWQILFFKELDFPLEQIKRILEDPGYDREAALMSHRRILAEKKNRIAALIASIDRTLKKGFDVGMLKTFDASRIDEYRKQYAEEAAEKYGAVYRKTAEKTAGYSDEQWSNLMEGAQEIFDALARCMEQGPGSAEAQALIARWQRYITTHFYECTDEILKGLGEMYTGDERFQHNIDRTKPGLAEFIKNAIIIFCEKRK